MTSRRTLLCGAAALGAGAIVPRAIGQRRDGAPLVFFVSSNTVAGTAPFLAAFLEGMRQAGQDEGRTFRIETRYADGQGDRLAALTRDAVAQGPAVLLVAGLTGGRVVVRLTVRTDGTIGAARVETSSGHPAWREAVLDAVRRWRYVRSEAVRSKVVPFELRVDG